MAKDALGIVECRLPIFKISTLGDFAQGGLQIRELPFPYKLPLAREFECRKRRVPGQVAQSEAVLVRQSGRRILSEIDQMFMIARTVAVISIRFFEPLQQLGGVSLRSLLL